MKISESFVNRSLKITTKAGKGSEIILVIHKSGGKIHRRAKN